MKGVKISQIILLVLLVVPYSLRGQIQQGRVLQSAANNEQTDSTIVVFKKSIFSILSEDSYGAGSINIIQDREINSLLDRYAEEATERKLLGYRIRIFNSNAQTARDASLEMETRFREKHPNVAVYRTFVDPNFRVTTGDFRTKSEAEKFKREIERDFPATFIVRENINFPPLW